MSRGGLKQRREGGDRAAWGIGGLRSASPPAVSSPCTCKKILNKLNVQVTSSGKFVLPDRVTWGKF